LVPPGGNSRGTLRAWVDDVAPAKIFERRLPREWAGELHAGARLGRYELLLPVGTGGMACVWAARLLGHRGFSKLVAIKTILPHLAQDTNFEKMFLDEARIAACVRHPNVCDLYELGEEGHVLYLAMEWINGDSLFRVLRPTGAGAPPLDARVAARIVADACAGLHAAHELADDTGRCLNVIHRDISPQNILLSLEGAVKVTDFGVAKARGQLHATTKGGQIKGKVGYMAPEQIRGAPSDRRADLFAMGCVLYQVSTGTRPFHGPNEAHVLDAICRGVYDPPRASGGYPPALARILERALANDPGQRFETAEQMGMALEGWLAESGAPVMAPQIAGCVRERLGEELAKRYARMREAMTELAKLSSTQPVSRSAGPPSATLRISSELTAVDIPIDVFTSYGVVSLTSEPAAERPQSRAHQPPEPVAPASTRPAPPPRAVRLALIVLLALAGAGIVLWVRLGTGVTDSPLRPMVSAAARPDATGATAGPIGPMATPPVAVSVVVRDSALAGGRGQADGIGPSASAIGPDDTRATAPPRSCAVCPADAAAKSGAVGRGPPGNAGARATKSAPGDDDIPAYR
jgi:eukaryotic-like serine/threonine-protein kinase